MANQDAKLSLTAPDQARTDDYRALYQRYLDLCNAHDFKAMQSFYTSPLNVNDEPWSPENVTAQFEPLIAAFPDWHWELRNLTIEGHFLSLHFKVTGTHKGEFQGYEPTGRRVATTQFTLYHVVGGRFAEVWDLVDFPSLIEQIK
ncbi:hypothetical protein FSARC_11322 [Fusarium sarcochroum]|uniref:Aspartyl-tRNA synthetase n=1 Tax=Fusarium sarcochroum TaxID=1208366 RepID=A0A8H4TG62_9HYPO|nr:hypothetical protein FSARC_11322 [Fusarium sarcochroum]